MNKNNYPQMILMIVLMLPLASKASEFSQQLQQLRVSALSVMTDFSLFVQMDGDTKYGRLIKSDASQFNEHLAQVLSNHDERNVLSLGDIERAWEEFYIHVSYCVEQQYKTGLVNDADLIRAWKLNQSLAWLVDGFYQDSVFMSGHDEKLSELREMAVMVEKLTFSRAWKKALDATAADVFPSEIERNDAPNSEEYSSIIAAFEERLALLVKRNDPSHQETLRGIQTEWGLLKRSLDPHASVQLPMLSVSLTDRIQQRFSQMEAY